MAIEFNVTAVHKFFLGEDKEIELTIFGQDNATPLDVAGLPLEWSLKRTDKAADPGIIEKSITAGGVSTGITITGAFNIDPLVNLQRVRIVFSSDDTDPAVTSLFSLPYTLRAGTIYRHSLKRTDPGNESVLTYGSMQFLQATER